MDWARSIRACHRAGIALVSIAVISARAHADSMPVTRAMQASTIAEVFIEGDQIRVEIEIGATDVASFANILPDELYEKVTGHAQPFGERLQIFLDRDWVIQADGQPLLGRLGRIDAAKRVVRDEVTGEALADQPEDAENVIRLVLRYPLSDRPQTLTIRPPLTGNDATASIGFVCYHNGLPVNDFRYLPGEVTLDLDWGDPWYSRFRHPNLLRQFDAPLSAYLYIEAYEVRKEIIVRPKDLQMWIDLGLRDDGVIPVDQQEELKNRVADFLSAKNSLTIDGQAAQGRLDRIHFIHRSLRTTGIIEPPVDLDATSATLGVIFVYPTEELPEEVSMKWELFNSTIPMIPAIATDEAGGMPTELSPDAPVLVWKNYLTSPTNPQMLNVARPPVQRQFTIPLLSVICGGVLLVMVAVLGRQWSAGRVVSRLVGVTSIIVFALGLMSLPFARVTVVNPFTEPPGLTEKEAKEILSGLLHNVYRSFDHHDESLIYDRLAQSISGEQLSEVYLETRRSMEIKNQGGLRISVKEVIVTELESLEQAGHAEHTFRCRWRVAGWIGHWGHVHRRANEHLAILTIAPRDGRWKVTEIEMLDEQPIESLQDTSDPQQGTEA